MSVWTLLTNLSSALKEPTAWVVAGFLLAIGWEAGKLLFRFLIVFIFRPEGTPYWPFTDKYD